MIQLQELAFRDFATDRIALCSFEETAPHNRQSWLTGILSAFHWSCLGRSRRLLTPSGGAVRMKWKPSNSFVRNRQTCTSTSIARMSGRVAWGRVALTQAAVVFASSFPQTFSVGSVPRLPPGLHSLPPAFDNPRPIADWPNARPLGCIASPGFGSGRMPWLQHEMARSVRNTIPGVAAAPLARVILASTT